MKRLQIILFAGITACSVMADDLQPATGATGTASDDKVSYALGMNLGLQIKRVGADVDVEAIERGIRDVLGGKPTELQMDELRPLFAKSQAYAIANRKAEGEAFLEKNAKVQGVTTLADGMQYQVIQPGAGNAPGSNDVAVINFRGTWINGKEFRRQDHVQVMPVICPKGIREALLQMKPGSKWRIFVPSDLAYGGQPSQTLGFGSTLIYDLELISTATDPDQKASLYGAGRLGHAPGEDFLPAVPGSRTAESQPQRANPSLILPEDKGQ